MTLITPDYTVEGDVTFTKSFFLQIQLDLIYYIWTAEILRYKTVLFSIIL